MKTRFLHINIYLVLLILSACATTQQNSFEGFESASSSEIGTKANRLAEQTNNEIDFNNFICGINSVVVITDAKLENSLNIENEFHRKYYKLFKNYLTGIGIENIAITAEEQNWIENNIALEKITTLRLSFDETKNYISKIYMIFKSCNGDEFKFSIDSDYYINKDWDQFLFEKMRGMFWQQVVYSSENTIQLKKEMTEWSVNSLKRNFDVDGVNDLEGIYEKYGVGNSKNELKYCIALVKDDDQYDIIYLDGARNKENWSEGELKGTITKTSIKDFYKVKWIMSDKSANENVYLNTSKYNFLEFDFLNSGMDYKTKYLKMYPVVSSKIVSSNNYLSSGTGFFISNKGHLVTNFHIVNGASNISIQIEKDNIFEEYKAEVISIDKKNDLAILKINNEDYLFRKTIPFHIDSSDSPIGTSVFTMGYPMIETMGESIKLSDGIISSQSGYMANGSAYQVTVPINPGNSGGPLFDKKGNLVGIINAKYTGAENVSYAIKSKILLGMLEGINISDLTPKLKNKNDLNLVENVKNLNSMVCLIKVYN